MIYPASADGNDIGWIDPRAQDEHGELLSPQEMAQFDGERPFDRARKPNFHGLFLETVRHFLHCRLHAAGVPHHDAVSAIADGDRCIHSARP
jgi:hypothetical protein